MNWKNEKKKFSKRRAFASLNSPHFAGREIVRAVGTKCSLGGNKQIIYGIMVNGMMHKMFSTREREKILDYLLSNPSKQHRVRSVARALKISVSSVSEFMSLLNKVKILKRRGNIFCVNAANPMKNAIRLMFNISRLDVAPLKKIPHITGIGLYGSWANGTNNEGSDIDIWVNTRKKPSEEIVARASRQLNKSMKADVQLLIMDPKKNEELRKNDPVFYYSLVYGSVIFYGEALTD